MANVVHIGVAPTTPAGSGGPIVRGAVYHLNSDVLVNNPMTAGGPTQGGPAGYFMFSFFDDAGVLCHDSLHSSMVTPVEWRVALEVAAGHRPADQNS